MYVHIDRKRKLPVTVLLKALGFVSEQRDPRPLLRERERGARPRGRARRTTGSSGASRPRTSSTRRPARSSSRPTRIDRREARREAPQGRGRTTVHVFVSRNRRTRPTSSATRSKKDSTATEEEALTRIYNLLRPGEPPRADTAREILTGSSSIRSATTWPRSAATS